MASKEKVTGWSRHQHFGLRKEWLELYFQEPQEWEFSGILGNRQVQSLKVWLKTAGLQDGRGKETFLAALFRKNGLEEILPWELLWVNVIFNFPTAAWYVQELGLGAWTTGKIKERLLFYAPHLALRTASNAVMELVGLLERTPVGREINQGEVFSLRPRRVQRRGHVYPSVEAICFAVFRLFEQEKRESLELRENLLWPWIIFGCAQKYVLGQLLCHGQKWFEVTGDCLIAKYIPEEWWVCGSMLTI
ncbi:MAG: hypothetical protein ACPLQO_02940 [Desulfotomaculales bacterium]